MQRIFSNRPPGDYLINPYRRLAASSKTLWIAAPYVTATDELLTAQKAGAEVQLIVGLNDCTSPKALAQINGLANFRIRYFTRRFHAKLYVFEEEAIVGSSNLTQGGLTTNREANVILNTEEDMDELRGLFSELWEDAQVLTPEKLVAFTKAWSGKRGAQDPDPWIESAVGVAEPQNSSVRSRTKSSDNIFEESLRRQISEYGSAFREINDVLTSHQLGRDELKTVGSAHRTNRFLNWVRLTKAPGEDAWKDAARRPTDQRAELITALGREWAGLDSDHTQIADEYLDWLHTVTATFASKDAIADATQEGLTAGLMSLHAFYERLRFVDGGRKNLPPFFWAANADDVSRVRRSLSFLVHGSGEFVDRLSDFLSIPEIKLAHFGKFCALELFGTVRPDLCPPMNGRTAKAMRFLGYSVSGV
jgi:predicted transcriptional regulator